MHANGENPCSNIDWLKRRESHFAVRFVLHIGKKAITLKFHKFQIDMASYIMRSIDFCWSDFYGVLQAKTIVTGSGSVIAACCYWWRCRRHRRRSSGWWRSVLHSCFLVNDVAVVAALTIVWNGILLYENWRLNELWIPRSIWNRKKIKESCVRMAYSLIVLKSTIFIRVYVCACVCVCG